MKLLSTKLQGVFIIEIESFEDQRGSFVKTFNFDVFKENNLETEFKESFYSISKKNVVRGMHFHLPPKDHSKLVYVTKGKALDVVLDIRSGSPTYGESISVEIGDENKKMIYIPRGCAHGFCSLEEDTCMVYLQTGSYSKEEDTGILYNSFGCDWGINTPIISQRDQGFQKLENFRSPFIYTSNETTS